MYNIAIVIDDFMDNTAFMKRTPDLDLLFLRGRHYYISVFVSVQNFRSLSNVIRLNISDMYIFRLGNQLDWDAFLEEANALVDKKQSKESIESQQTKNMVF